MTAWTSWNDYGGTTSATSDTWSTWTSDHYYTATSPTSTVWVKWASCDTASASTISYTTHTWEGWNEKYVAYEPPVRTEEQVRRDEEYRQRMEQLAREEAKRRDEENKRRQEAEEKALQLLLENLTENQAEVYKATGAIPIECSSGRKYHIRKGIAQNVHELNEKGETARRLCFHPTGCPVHDVMLAQKLMLETCEEDARRIANFS